MELLDVVALIADLPEHNLARGQIGTIVEILDREHVLVEVADADGVARAIVPVPLGLLGSHTLGR